VQVEGAISQDEVDLTAQTVAARSLVGTQAARHQVSAVERQQADVLQALPRHDALVEGQRSVRPKYGLDGRVALVRLDHLGDRAHRHLGRQAEAFVAGTELAQNVAHVSFTVVLATTMAAATSLSCAPPAMRLRTSRSRDDRLLAGLGCAAASVACSCRK
jgi:hypothetical protein